MRRNESTGNFNYMFIIAQICGSMSAASAVLGIILLILDWLCCSCIPCCSGDWGLILGACLTQAGTFLIYGQTEFCFEEYSEECKFGPGGIASVVAAGLFYLSSTVICCFPRPKSIMDTMKKKRNRAHDDD